MKARELLEQKKADVPDGARETMPPSMVVHDLDGSYELYRLLISMAGMPDNHAPFSSVTPDRPYIAPYTAVERDHIKHLLKKMGKHPTDLTTEKSTEPKFVHSASPVRPFRDLDT